MESDSGQEHSPFLSEWDGYEEEPAEPHRPGWRRPLIVAVAIVTAISLAAVPLYNLIDRGQPPVAANGLEVCGFDYCAVQEAVRAAGLDLEMSRLSNLILDDSAAIALAAELAAYLGIEEVGLAVVDELGGRLGGVFDAATRSIIIERPVNAWIVMHEVAHAVAPGHDDRFRDVLIDLAAHMAEVSRAGSASGLAGYN